jgi:replicative DNA helicase
MLETYNLADDYVDAAAEQSLIAAVAARPSLYWKLLDLLPSAAFAAEAAAWEAVTGAIQQERVPQLAQTWPAAIDAEAVATQLADLFLRRQIASAHERSAQALRDRTRPARDVAGLLEEEAGRIQAAVRELRECQLQWGTDLAAAVLSEAETRRRRREETGKAVMGISTGLTRFDEMTNGLTAALYVLAGAPGMGKTTLAVQLAVHAAYQGVPTVYVTYENSPSNIILKAVCARARVPASSVERGFGEPAKLQVAAYEMRGALQHLAVVEGTSRLKVSEVRARAFQVMNRFQAERCLIVFDYLQRAAHAGGYADVRHNVSAIAGDLRDLANRLGSPVLALSSQNRSGGNYGANDGDTANGSARLDSLKESGDLEYGADLVAFLKRSAKRTAAEPARAVDLVIAKNRHGDIGSIPLIFKADVGVILEEARGR